MRRAVSSFIVALVMFQLCACRGFSDNLSKDEIFSLVNTNIDLLEEMVAELPMKT